jgi:hypothetical protein
MTATSSQFQFARVEARPCRQAADLLREALRVEGYVSHIPHPHQPAILFGSLPELATALRDEMSKPTPVKSKGGTVRYRKVRKDHRGLVTGILSHPVAMSNLMATHTDLRPVIGPWIDDAVDFARAEFGEYLKLVVLHTDETFPHLHFYACGSAQQLHPGLRSELDNGTRIPDGKERVRRHREGLRLFLDRFHDRVGARHGHTRKGDRRPYQRIKSRAVYLALKTAENTQRRLRDPELKALLDRAWGNSAEFEPPMQRARHGE